MDRVSGRKTGLRLLFAIQCAPGFRSHLWLSLQSERTLAPDPTQLWRAVGLERTADDVIRSSLARNFSGSEISPHGSRRPRGRIEYSRTRIEISSRRRSAHAQPRGSRLLQATCGNVSRSRRTA